LQESGEEENEMHSDRLPNPVMSPELPSPETETECTFCSLLCPNPGQHGSDHESMHLLTGQEILLLERMKQRREESQKVRRRVRQIEDDLSKTSFTRTADGKEWCGIRGKIWAQTMAADLLNLADRLARLSENWERMDRERVEAAAERMRLLGQPE